MRHIVGEKRHRKRIQGCLENETHFFVNSSQQQQSQSHFEELKSKQKQEQTKFTQRLLHDLELDHNKINNTPNLDKKFLNVDMIQDSPVPSHTHDPIGHQSPIPRKRLVEPTTTAWNFIPVHMAEMLSPVIGDFHFAYRYGTHSHSQIS